MDSLVSTATNIVMKILQIKLTYIRNTLQELSVVQAENPRSATPPELSYAYYEEWLETNQQLFELNSQLFELERVKFDFRKRQEEVRKALSEDRQGQSRLSMAG